MLILEEMCFSDEDARKEIRVHLCRSRTYDFPITSSDALQLLLSYRRLVGDGGSGIFGKNPSAPLKESHLATTFRILVRDALPVSYK